MSLLKKRPVTANKISKSGSLATLQATLAERWQTLAPRDRMALTILILFLLLLIGGYGGYTLHTHAKQSKADYNQQIEDYFWLRTQAGNINTDFSSGQDPQNTQPPATQISMQLSQSGVSNPQVVATGDSVQMSFENSSQAIVGRALSNLQQQGWQFNRLNVQQNPVNKQIMVQAVLSRS